MFILAVNKMELTTHYYILYNKYNKPERLVKDSEGKKITEIQGQGNRNS